MRRLATLLLAGVAALVVIAFAIGNPVAWVQAGLIMWDIAAGGGHTIWQDVTAAPDEKPVKWKDGEGDLYRPAGQVRGAMVLVPGADVLGRDEPRLKALARTFGRAGFAVLVPELPEVRRLRLSRADAERHALLAHAKVVQRGCHALGVAAVSYAVAPAIIAVLQEDLAPRVGFVVGIGGYRDAESVIRFVTTGSFRPRGDSRAAETSLW